MASERRISFDGLSTTLDPTQVEPGAVVVGTNARYERKILEIGPRWGDRWQRGSYAGTDEGRGFGYFEFQDKKEYLALVKQVDGFVHAYSINPATGVWTAITAGSTNAQTLGNHSAWHMVQAQGYVYVYYASLLSGLWSGGFYRRKIGDNSTSEAWEEFEPAYEFGRDYGLTILSDEKTLSFGRVTQVLDASGFTGTVDRVSTQGFRLNCGATAAGTMYFVLETPQGIDFTETDMVAVAATRAGTWGASQTWYLAAVDDDASTVNLAWCQSLKFASVTPVNTAGSIWKAVFDLRSLLGKPGSRKSAKRIVFALQADPDSAGCTWEFQEALLGGLYTYDVASVSTIRAAYRWENTKGATKVTTPSYRLPDVNVDALRGTLVHASLARLGSVAVFDVPFDARKADQGYDQIAYYISDSVTPTVDYDIVGTAKNRDGETSLVHTQQQSQTDADSVAVTPKDRTPSQWLFDSTSGSATPWRGLGVLGQHLVLGGGGYVWLSHERRPEAFVPPSEDGPTYDDPFSLARGRTFPVSLVGTQEALAFVDGGAGVWYFATDRAVYAMTGDLAATSGAPRPLAFSDGLVSRRGFTRWRGGAVAALRGGIAYYSVSGNPGDTNVPANDPSVDLTAGVRPSYQTLLGSDASGLVLAEDRDSLWAFNSGRYMRLTRLTPSGQRSWEEGEFPTVVGAAWTPSEGFRVMFSDGRVAKVDDSYTTDGGATVTWTAQTGDIIVGREQITGVRVIGEGSPNIKIATLNLGGGGSSWVEQTLDQTGVQLWMKNVRLQPGELLRITATGTGADKVKDVVIVTEGRGGERGP